MGAHEGEGKDAFSGKWSPRDTAQQETTGELRALTLKWRFLALQRNSVTRWCGRTRRS